MLSEEAHVLRRLVIIEYRVPIDPPDEMAENHMIIQELVQTIVK